MPHAEPVSSPMMQPHRLLAPCINFRNAQVSIAASASPALQPQAPQVLHAC